MYKKKTQIEMYVIRESKKSNVNYALKKKEGNSCRI